jgi:hypothetical protein
MGADPISAQSERHVRTPSVFFAENIVVDASDLHQRVELFAHTFLSILLAIGTAAPVLLAIFRQWPRWKDLAKSS